MGGEVSEAGTGNYLMLLENIRMFRRSAVLARKIKVPEY